MRERAPILDAAARWRLAEAVRAAERGTTGEIVVMVAGRAGAYRSIHLLAALLVGLAVPWALLATEWPLVRLLAAQLAAVALVLGLARLPGTPRLIPRAIRRARARDAATRAFWTRGLSRTRARTGVLIYVALAERYADVVADFGLDGRVGEGAWRAVIADLVAGLARGALEEGLTTAVAAVGAILAEHAPAAADAPDPDELPNQVIVSP